MIYLISFVAGFATCYFILGRPIHLIVERKFPTIEYSTREGFDEYVDFEHSENDIKNPNRVDASAGELNRRANALISKFIGGSDEE